MKRITGFVFALAVALPVISPAAVITQNLGFNNSTAIINGNGTNISPLLFNAFDTNSGTLDTVDIRITGNLLVNVTSPPSLQGPTPVPYAFGLTSELDFGGFGFVINPTIIANGTNPGVTIPHAFNYEYTFDATLDASSDSLGFASIGTSSMLNSVGLAASEIRPPLMSLSRDDVSANAPGLSFLLLPRLSVSGFSSAAVAPSGNAASTGNIAITYNYTPFATPMPEPGSIALLSLGLMLGFRTRSGSRSKGLGGQRIRRATFRF